MDVATLRRAAKRMRDLKPDLDAVKELLETAAKTGSQDEMVIASLVFMRHKAKLRAVDWPDVRRWAQGIESPEAADLFAQYVAAPLYARAPVGSPVPRWAASSEPLLRRLALRVAGLAVAEALAGDEDILVQEALVDMLLTEDDEEEVYRFLVAHPDMPQDVIRQAASALTPEHAIALTIAQRGGRSPHDRRPSRRRRDE